MIVAPEVNLDAEIQTGDIVQRFLDDKDIQATLEQVRRDIKDEWERESQPNGRERLHAELAGLARLVNRMQGIAQAGEHARHQRDRASRSL